MTELNVGLGAGASLHQRDAGGGVGCEDVHQTVAAVATEARNVLGDVGDVVARLQGEFGRLHEPTVPRRIT